MEPWEHEVVPTWDAGATGRGLASYATVPAPELSSYQKKIRQDCYTRDCKYFLDKTPAAQTK